MIAKGHIDKGEDIKTAALREAAEELGLRTTNIVDGTLKESWVGSLEGQVDSYTLHVYTCRIDDVADFDTPHYETERVEWLTAEEFARKGRKSQKHIVAAVAKLIV